MLAREVLGGAVGPAEHDGHRELAARHVAHLGRLVDHLVHGEEGEVVRHPLDDGPEARDRRAHARAREAELGDGRVADPLGPVLGEEALRDLVGPVVLAHLLAHEEDPPSLAISSSRALPRASR